MNRKHKIIKPITAEDIDKMKNSTKEERVKSACSVATPQGFARFYTYYFRDQINFAHADFHYDIMEVLWIMIQGKNIKSALARLGYDDRTIAEYLDGIDDYVDEVLAIGFRESAKTTMFKAFLIYVICYELRRYINVDAFDKTNSERVLFDVVYNLQSNVRLIEDYGHLYTTTRTKDETDQKRVSDFLTNRTEHPVTGQPCGQIRVEAHSTQTPVRGRQHNSKRPDMLWLEDFETEDTVNSEARTKAIEAHIASFKGGLADTGNWILYSANYLSEYGNVQSLIDKCETNGHMVGFIIPIYTDDNVLTWPEKYVMTNAEAMGTRKVSVQSKKEKMWTPEKGDQSFTMEMLCKPIDFSVQEFKKTMFKYITWEELAQIQTVLYITIDSGGSSKDTQRKRDGKVDDTGICYNWVDKYGNWYIKTDGKKMDAMEIMELIFANNIGYKQLEQQGIEETMFVEAIKPFYDVAKKERNQYPRLKMLHAGGRNKENRIRGLIPRMEAGTVFFIKGQNNKLEDQLLRFPRAKHDDVADALAYQNDVARKPTFPDVDPYKKSVGDRGGAYENDGEPSPFAGIGL